MTEVVHDINQLPNIDRRVAAQLLQVSRARLEQYVDKGVFTRLGTVQNYYFKLNEFFVDYVSYLKRESKIPTASADRVRNAKAREIEIRSAERAGRLIDVEDVEARFVQFAGKIRSMHAALSSRVTRDLNLRKTIDREINYIDNAAADWLEALASDLETGLASDAPADDDDAGRVGRKQQSLSTDGTDTGST